jgi:hypothetical protein
MKGLNRLFLVILGCGFFIRSANASSDTQSAVIGLSLNSAEYQQSRPGRILHRYTSPQNDNFIINNTPYTITIYASGIGFTHFDEQTGKVTFSNTRKLEAGEKFDSTVANSELREQMLAFRQREFLEIYTEADKELLHKAFREMKRAVEQEFAVMEYNEEGDPTDLNDIDGVLLATHTIKIQNLRNMVLNYDEQFGFTASFTGIDDIRWWKKRDPSGWYDLNGVYQGSCFLPYNNTAGIKVKEPRQHSSRRIKNWRNF